MTEWLTTGSMIDRLKVGEIAESEQLLSRVINRDGAIVFERCQDLALSMNHVNMKLKWRILPNYVSFEVAMNALKNGKCVRMHKNESDIDDCWLFTPPAYTDRHDALESLSLKDLIESRWSIVEENK